MSVEHEAMMTIGWRVEQDDIPNFEERHDEEWPELEGLAEKVSELLGRSVWQSELCEVENSWCGDTQIIGVPMIEEEMPIKDFTQRTYGLVNLARDVYRQVMRKEPEDGPYLMSWMRVF